MKSKADREILAKAVDAVRKREDARIELALNGNSFTYSVLKGQNGAKLDGVLPPDLPKSIEVVEYSSIVAVVFDIAKTRWGFNKILDVHTGTFHDMENK